MIVSCQMFTVASMRRSDHPSRPSAMTCCFFPSLKALLTLTEGNPYVRTMSRSVNPLAAFQVITIGRFWVIPRPLFIRVVILVTWQMSTSHF